MNIKSLIKECINEVLAEDAAGAVDKLSQSDRNKLAQGFKVAKLDGNGRFQKKEHGLQAVSKVLSAFGFQLDMVSGDLIMGDKGQRMFVFRRANAEGQDPYTEQPEIANSRIVFVWENLARPGQPAQFEILVYAS